jgi:uncharacterized iron-regulated membrane protein
MKACFVVLLLVTSTLAWFVFEGTYFNAIGQEPTPALPMVSAAPVPLYPLLARHTNTQGIIHVKIQTDGQKVVQAHAEETNKLLSVAAEENAKNWEFSKHTPVTFTITYRYRLTNECDSNNPTVTLHLPTKVEVCQHTFRLD